MEDPQVEHNLWALRRGKRFDVLIHSGATLKDLGHELQKLTDVKADTMRLIVPKFSDKSSKMLFPFSDEHQNLSLQEASFVEVSSEYLKQLTRYCYFLLLLEFGGSTSAMEFLLLIGSNESVMDGKQETYLVLKRDDPGLLWLAKSTLETCIS